jgi:hypothetical protein
MMGAEILTMRNWEEIAADEFWRGLGSRLSGFAHQLMSGFDHRYEQ